MRCASTNIPSRRRACAIAYADTTMPHADHGHGHNHGHGHGHRRGRCQRSSHIAKLPIAMISVQPWPRLSTPAGIALPSACDQADGNHSGESGESPRAQRQCRVGCGTARAGGKLQLHVSLWRMPWHARRAVRSMAHAATVRVLSVLMCYQICVHARGTSVEWGGSTHGSINAPESKSEDISIASRAVVPCRITAAWTAAFIPCAAAHAGQARACSHGRRCMRATVCLCCRHRRQGIQRLHALHWTRGYIERRDAGLGTTLASA